jgi:hypothetical protein
LKGFSWNEKVSYYLIKDQPVQVDSKKALLAALSDKSSELKNYMDEYHLNFRKNKEKSFIKILQYYSSLN